jgi:outer membrane protein
MRMVFAIVNSASLLLAAVPAYAQGPLQVSLKRAVEIAASPKGNVKIQLSGEALNQARSRSAQSRAALLPDLSAAFGEQSRTMNLSSSGFKITAPIPGFQIPSFVGPFTVMDARVSASQTVFDFSAFRRFQASKVAVGAAQSDLGAAEEQVAAQVARAYLAAIKADADVETAEANVKLSEAVQTQAENQKQAGTGTGIEITRARVQLANDKQRLLAAQNARRASRLQLLRAMAVPLDTEVELTDRLQFVPVDSVTLEQAKALAVKQRPDLQAQQQREANARLSASATKLERLPTVSAFGDYGSNGAGFDSSLPTRTYGISLRVPIFDGGRKDARRVESESVYRAEKARTGDLKEQIELDIRLALDALRNAEDQVAVAKDGLALSENELTQARRRYDAGVTNSLEVTDAQTRLERARDNQTAAVYIYNVARVDLAQAMGKVRGMVY